jgi:hypothetical protein
MPVNSSTDESVPITLGRLIALHALVSGSPLANNDRDLSGPVSQVSRLTAGSGGAQVNGDAAMDDITNLDNNTTITPTNPHPDDTGNANAGSSTEPGPLESTSNQIRRSHSVDTSGDLLRFACGHQIDWYTHEVAAWLKSHTPFGATTLPRPTPPPDETAINRASYHTSVRCYSCVAKTRFFLFGDPNSTWRFYIWDRDYHDKFIRWWQTTGAYEQFQDDIVRYPDMVAREWDWITPMPELLPSVKNWEHFAQCAEASNGNPWLLCVHCHCVIHHPAEHVDQYREEMDEHVEESCPRPHGRLRVGESEAGGEGRGQGTGSEMSGSDGMRPS